MRWDWFGNLLSVIVGKKMERVDVVDGWLTFAERIPMHASWRYTQLRTPGSTPRAIVCHYTATDPGTARNMAKRRQAKRTKKDRPASWHISIEADGTVIQMAPLTAGTWHAGSDTARQIPGVGWANHTSVGIELVGHGKVFPEVQVAAAKRVWRAIVQAYGIERKHAMVAHAALDPGRRSDPGPVWLTHCADRVLDAAYAE